MCSASQVGVAVFIKTVINNIHDQKIKHAGVARSNCYGCMKQKKKEKKTRCQPFMKSKTIGKMPTTCTCINSYPVVRETNTSFPDKKVNTASDCFFLKTNIKLLCSKIQRFFSFRSHCNHNR